MSHRFLCLKIPRVLSEFSKAQVNSVPTDGLSQEEASHTPKALSSALLPGLHTSTHLHSDLSVQPLPSPALSSAPDGGRSRKPLSQAWDMPSTAPAVPAGSTPHQQPSSPVGELTRSALQGSSQPKFQVEDGAGLSLVVPSPTSPVSGASVGRADGSVTCLCQ